MAVSHELAAAGPPAAAHPGRTLREALWLAEGHLQAGDLAAAEQAFRRIVQAEPACAEGWFFLGVVRQAGHEIEAAVDHYERAIRLAPDLAEGHNNLGVILQRQARFATAEGCFREALRQMADYPEAWSNLGNVLQDQGRFAEAVDAYRRALAQRQNAPETLRFLGNALRALGRIDEAMAAYDAGLRLVPDDALLHMSRAMVWLQEGDHGRGWAECEWRLRGKDMPLPPLSQPRWDGSPLDGRTILVLCEQGLGDAIQFFRYLPMVAERGGRVVLACSPALIRLARAFASVAEVVTDGETVRDFDCYIPLLSLPMVLGTRLETIPADVPYLSIEPDVEARWRRELAHDEGFKIGVVWQGNPGHTKDRERSFRLRAIETVANVPGVRLYSLQKNHGLEQLDEVTGRFPVIDLGPRLDDFMDTAAAMRCLDLVISPDSSPAHLAGALGVPVWAALPEPADWRWMTGRVDTPWYPSMRLFRQPSFGDWDGVFAAMARALGPLVEGRR